MIRRINLLPEDLRIAPKGRFFLFTAVSLLLYISILYSFYYYRQAGLAGLSSEKDAFIREIAALNAEESKYREVVEKINATEMKKKEMAGKAELASSLFRERMAWSDGLYELSGIVPDGLWLSSLSSFDVSIGDRKVKGLKVSGMAFSSAMIADLMAGIDSSAYFEGSSMTYVQNVDYQGSEAFSFELTFRFRGKR